MDTWLKPLVFALTALGLLPFVLTHLLFSSARFDSEKAHLKKAFLPGLLLNLLGNAAAGYVIAAFLFHTRRPWTPLKRILRLEGAWPEVVRLAVLAASCAVVGVLLGLVLRRLLLRKDRAPVSEGRRAAALLLCAICGALTFFACCEAVRNNQRVSLSEVCRKTAVYVIDPNQEEDLGDGYGYGIRIGNEDESVTEPVYTAELLKKTLFVINASILLKAHTNQYAT